MCGYPTRFSVMNFIRSSLGLTQVIQRPYEFSDNVRCDIEDGDLGGELGLYTHTLKGPMYLWILKYQNETEFKKTIKSLKQKGAVVIFVLSDLTPEATMLEKEYTLSPYFLLSKSVAMDALALKKKGSQITLASIFKRMVEKAVDKAKHLADIEERLSSMRSRAAFRNATVGDMLTAMAHGATRFKETPSFAIELDSTLDSPFWREATEQVMNGRRKSADSARVKVARLRVRVDSDPELVIWVAKASKLFPIGEVVVYETDEGVTSWQEASNLLQDGIDAFRLRHTHPVPDTTAASDGAFQREVNSLMKELADV
jgi:hypothetical protein